VAPSKFPGADDSGEVGVAAQKARVEIAARARKSRLIQDLNDAAVRVMGRLHR